MPLGILKLSPFTLLKTLFVFVQISSRLWKFKSEFIKWNQAGNFVGYFVGK
jgi:hypothetical protein